MNYLEYVDKKLKEELQYDSIEKGKEYGDVIIKTSNPTSFKKYSFQENIKLISINENTVILKYIWYLSFEKKNSKTKIKQESTSNVSESVTKRKRGRPKKVQTVVDVHVTEEVTKRKRGRPKKYN